MIHPKNTKKFQHQNTPEGYIQILYMQPYLPSPQILMPPYQFCFMLPPYSQTPQLLPNPSTLPYAHSQQIQILKATEKDMQPTSVYFALDTKTSSTDDNPSNDTSD